MTQKIIAISAIAIIFTANPIYADLWKKSDSIVTLIHSSDTLYRCPDSINTHQMQYSTVPSSSETLQQETRGGNLSAGVHALTQTYIAVSTTPNWIGMLGCRYGAYADLNYVVYNQTSMLQHYPGGGHWILKMVNTEKYITVMQG